MSREQQAYQISMALGHTEYSLRMVLEKALGRAVNLVLTDNSTAMLSARVKGGVMEIRLHRMFLLAPGDVIDEIVIFIKKRRRSMPLFRQFIRDHKEHIRRKPPHRVSAKTEGRVHDLRAIFDKINMEYFNGEIDALITWGKSNPRCFVRKRTLGSYSVRNNSIRINTSMDSGRVPLYFIEYVVYHEMLHAAIGIQEKSGRRSIHPAEFRKREKQFKHYERAMAWERKSYQG
jgi:hypothetical protein